MSKQNREIVDRLKELRYAGWDVSKTDIGHINAHSGHESAPHYHVKAAICNVLANETHAFSTEVVHPDRGQVDVLDLNSSDEFANVYEVETDCRSEKRRQKAMRYTNDACCDVIGEVFVIDPLDAPDMLSGLNDWVREQMSI